MTALDLRPLSLGELLDRTFFLYRRNFFLFTGIAAIPYSLFFVVNLVSTLLTRFRFGGRRFSGFRPDSASVIGRRARQRWNPAQWSWVLAGFIAYLFSVGATVFAVSEIYTGHQTSIQASLHKVRGHAGTIFGVLFLSGLIMMGGFILLIHSRQSISHAAFASQRPRPCSKILGRPKPFVEVLHSPRISPVGHS